MLYNTPDLRGKSVSTTNPVARVLGTSAPDARRAEALTPRIDGAGLGRTPVESNFEPTAARNSGTIGNGCSIGIKAI